MNEIYNFNWIIEEIDNNIIFELYDGDKWLGIYQVSEILTKSFDELNIKFANIRDLIVAIDYSAVRFTNISDKNNFIDVPINKLYALFENSTILGEEFDKKEIKLSTLDAFGIYKNEILGNKSYMLSFRVNDPSEELTEIMNIAHNFGNLGMQEKTDSLFKINEINYKRSKTREFDRR